MPIKNSDDDQLYYTHRFLESYSNKINTSIKLPLFIAINIADDEKIIKFEESIKKFDLVSSYRVSKLDNKKIYYKVIFNGTPKSFILQMKNFGHELDIKKKIWILK